MKYFIPIDMTAGGIQVYFKNMLQMTDYTNANSYVNLGNKIWDSQHYQWHDGYPYRWTL